MITLHEEIILLDSNHLPCNHQLVHLFFLLQIVKDGKFSHFVDGHNESQSNWMRFVNCSRCEDEQNLVAYQFRGEMYYRTYKSIKPGQELLVWYGESYAKDLGISLNDDQDRSSTKSTVFLIILNEYNITT